MHPNEIIDEAKPKSTTISPIQNMVIRMTVYGLMLGSIAGILVAFEFFSIFDNLVATMLASLIFGLALGGFWGGFSGAISGLAMSFVTAMAFRQVHYVIGFRFIMGIIAGVITTVIFWFGGFWDFFTGSWSYEIIVSVIIAVYASQIVSKKYIQESTIHKKKKGVA